MIDKKSKEQTLRQTHTHKLLPLLVRLTMKHTSVCLTYPPYVGVCKDRIIIISVPGYYRNIGPSQLIRNLFDNELCSVSTHVKLTSVD